MAWRVDESMDEKVDELVDGNYYMDA